MTIRVFNEGWRHQYHRMKRSRDRFNAPHQIAEEYDDDFYHAIQDTWHLRDWIANDATLGPLGARIAQEATTIPLLDILPISRTVRSTSYSQRRSVQVQTWRARVRRSACMMGSWTEPSQ